MSNIKASELITNADGSIFHLHLMPEDISENIILLGDPHRVDTVSSFFDIIELKKSDREFCTVTGSYKGKRISVISTGIGPDNIDIVMNELDALANIDIKGKVIRDTKKQLKIVRIGTSGTVQSDIEVGSFVISEKSLGTDGVLHFYKGSEAYRDLEFEADFIETCDWDENTARPYLVSANEELVSILHSEDKTHKGVTLTAVGFYGPQGRELRMPIKMCDINNKITNFEHEGHKILNYEMESAAIIGLSRIMGHKATAICLIIANRITGEALPNYKEDMNKLIKYTLDKITSKK